MFKHFLRRPVDLHNTTYRNIGRKQCEQKKDDQGENQQTADEQFQEKKFIRKVLQFKLVQG